METTPRFSAEFERLRWPLCLALISGFAVHLARPPTRWHCAAMVIAIAWAPAFWMLPKVFDWSCDLIVLVVNGMLTGMGYGGKRIRQRQFSLRELLIVPALCSLVLVGWTQWIRPEQEEREFVAAVARAGGGSSAQVTPSGISVTLIGNRLGGGNKITDRDLMYLASLPGSRRVSAISLFGCEISDDALSLISRFPQLSSVRINECPNISERGLEHFFAIPRLSELHVARCPKITEDGATRFLGKYNGSIQVIPVFNPAPRIYRQVR